MFELTLRSGSSVGLGSVVGGQGSVEAASVRDPVGPINLLHNSSLKQVLLVLQYNAALCHEDRVRAHVIKVLWARGSRRGLLGVLAVDPRVSALGP